MFGCDKISSDIIDLIIKGFGNQIAVELRIGLFLRPELASDRAPVTLRLTFASNLPCKSICSAIWPSQNHSPRTPVAHRR
jgi:hypothetical protein